MENRQKKELARKRMIIHSALCALVPPAGMLLVWRNRYPKKTKLLMTLCSTAVLTLMCCVYLALQEPEEIVPPVYSAGYANSQTQQEQQAQEEIYTEPAAQETPQPEAIDDSFVAPANPNG